MTFFLMSESDIFTLDELSEQLRLQWLMYDYEGHYDQVEVYMSIVSVVETIGKKEKVTSLWIMTDVRYPL